MKKKKKGMELKKKKRNRKEIEKGKWEEAERKLESLI